MVDPLITALGSDYSYYESPSCAYIGLDKCYVYNGFSIYTYPDDNAVDHVLQIILTDDTLSTPEGLIIGDTAEKVIELYVQRPSFRVPGAESHTRRVEKRLQKGLVLRDTVKMQLFSYYNSEHTVHLRFPARLPVPGILVRINADARAYRR